MAALTIDPPSTTEASEPTPRITPAPVSSAEGLDKRDSSTERLEQAAVAYQAALEKQVLLEDEPRQWARTQMNLGVVLTSLGERKNSTEQLEQAVTAYRAALEKLTREREPLQWAKTQMNLGVTLASLAKREQRRDQRADLLTKALEAVHGAQETYAKAGISQYGQFTARIKELEAAIATPPD